MLNIDETLFAQCTEAWGETLQFDMMIEECAELIQAIQHLRRGRCDLDKVAEEVADVILMAYQVSDMIDNERVKEWLDKKMSRLRRRLDESSTSREVQDSSNRTAE